MRRASMVAPLALVLALGFAAEAHAGLVIQTPTGLDPSDQFTVMFLTSGSFSVASSMIGTYNTDVTTAANNAGVTYNGTSLTWTVFGATDADNEASMLLSSPAPVYSLLANDLIASSGSALLASHGPQIDEFGLQISNYPHNWYANLTGLGDNGNTVSGHALGDSTIEFGNTGEANFWYGREATTLPFNSVLIGYVTLTVPVAATTPEPASLMLALVGAGVLVGARLARRRRTAAPPLAA
jgi:PEP-CTERM motif-containing protein